MAVIDPTAIHGTNRYVQLVGVGSDGKQYPIKVDEVTGAMTVGGSGGASATEATLLAVKAAIETMDIAVDATGITLGEIDVSTDEVEELLRILGNVDNSTPGTPLGGVSATFSTAQGNVSVTAIDLNDTFVSGMQVLVSGSVSNNVTYSVTGITPAGDSMTLSPDPVDEGPVVVTFTPFGRASELITNLRAALAAAVGIRAATENTEALLQLTYGSNTSVNLESPVISHTNITFASVAGPNKGGLMTFAGAADLTTLVEVGEKLSIKVVNPGTYEIISVTATTIETLRVSDGTGNYDSPGTFSGPVVTRVGGTSKALLISKEINTKTPALGTAIMTASTPVTIATDDTLTVAANALLTTIDIDTGNIATDTSNIADAVSANSGAVTKYVALAADNGLGGNERLVQSGGNLHTYVQFSALPTGAATSAIQTTSEAILTTIDTDTGVIAGDTTSLDAKAPALGTAIMTGATPVTIATDDTMTAAANALLTTIDADTGSMLTTQTDGSQKTQIFAGATGLTATGTALDVNIGSSAITVDVNLDNTDDDVLIYGWDGLGNQKILTDGDGTLHANVTASALPTGASTSALQTTSEAILTTIDADTGSILTDTGVIAADTTSLDAKTPALGTAAMAASTPVTIASDDTLTAAANALLGTIDTDTGVIAGDTTLIAAAISPVGGAIATSVFALGYNNGLNEEAVTESTGLPVRVNSSTLPALAATSTLQTSSEAILTTIDADTGSILTDTGVIAGDTTSLDAKTPALGTAIMTGATPVTIATDDTITAAGNASAATTAAKTTSIDDSLDTVLSGVGNSDKLRVSVESMNVSPAYNNGTAYIVVKQKPTVAIGEVATTHVTPSTISNPLSTVVANSVTIKARASNTQDVVIGTVGVTVATGFALEPGASIGGWEIDNLDELYMISTAASQVLEIFGS